MPVYGLDEKEIYFPDPTLAEDDGQLAELLEENGFLMIDCQFHTPHLESMGGVHISYDEYKQLLKEGIGV